MRRLILLAAMLPTLCFATMSVWLGMSGEGPALGIVSFGLICGGIITGHVILFPNVIAETLSLSLGLAVSPLFETLIPSGSDWRYLEGPAVIWIILLGQLPIGLMQLRGAKRPYVFKSQITTEKSIAEARAHFTLRPDHVAGNWTCGPADSRGMFPISLKMPEGTMPASTMVAVDNTECQTQSSGTCALISKDEETYQETVVFETNANGDWDVSSMVVHTFERTKEGCIVTKTDAPDEFSNLMALGMWLTDYQYDGLVYMRDLPEKRTSRAFHTAHHMSILILLGNLVANHGLAEPKS